MRVLIVEDNELHIASARKFASETEHQVTIVTNYDQAENELCAQGDRFGRKESEPKYDVLLTDLFLPASTTGQGDKSHQREMPYGATLVLLAMRSGIKKIALLTDGNHHAHPLIWALDPLGGYDAKPFSVGEVKLLFASNGFVYNSYSQNELTVDKDNPLNEAKAWPFLLNKLLS